MRFLESIAHFLVVWGYAGFGLLAIAAFLAPLLEPITKENPIGNPGPYAPILALCAAGMAILDAMHKKESRFSWMPKLCIGLIASASAYMWLAAEVKVHPSDPSLSLELLLLLGVATLVAIVVPILAGRRMPTEG